MLLKYIFENVFSFNESVEFSMLAPNSKVKNRYPDNYVCTDSGYEVLKSAVIVGENAGGKSNFVRSLEYLQSFFSENTGAKAYRNTVNTNRLLTSCPRKDDYSQKFELEVIVNGIVYLYYLEIDYSGIAKEQLCCKNKRTQKYKLLLLAERKINSMKCNGDLDNCSNKECFMEAGVSYRLDIPGITKEMREVIAGMAGKKGFPGLFVNKLAILGEEHAVEFTDWMKEKLKPETNIINYDIYKEWQREEEDLKIIHDSRYFEIFRMIDYSIVSIDLDEEKPYSKTRVFRKKENGEIFSRELSEDSSGVREFFAWAVQIFKVVYMDRVVFADEMDRVLNPVLSDRVLAFINGKDHRGQFIFTTHNALHLNLKKNMKEQIYFITKDIENLNSELYSLADFPEIRYETTKIYELYMKGVLGGTAVE